MIQPLAHDFFSPFISRTVRDFSLLLLLYPSVDSEVGHENPTSPRDSSDSNEVGDDTVQNLDETGMVYRSFKSKKTSNK